MSGSDTRNIDEVIAGARSHYDDLSADLRRAGALCSEKLASIPESLNLRAVLAEIAEVETKVKIHIGQGREVQDRHTHATCALGGGTLCPRCAEWKDLCEQRDRCQRQIVTFAFALQAAG